MTTEQHQPLDLDDSSSSLTNDDTYDEHPLISNNDKITNNNNNNQRGKSRQHQYDPSTTSTSITLPTTPAITTTNTAPAIVVGGGRFTFRTNQIPSSSSTTTTTIDGITIANPLLLGGTAESFSFSDVLRLRFSRLLQSNYYHVLYVIMILLCLILLIWSIVQRGHPRHPLFLYLETIVTICLVVEVFMRLCLVERENFFASYWNWLDFIISILCVISFFVYLVKRRKAGSTANGSGSWEGFADTALISFRYFSQIARIILFVRKQRQQRALANQQYIDLTNTQGPDVDLSLIDLQQNSTIVSLRRSSLGMQQHSSSDEEEEENHFSDDDDEQDGVHSPHQHKQQIRRQQEEEILHMT